MDWGMYLALVLELWPQESLLPACCTCRYYTPEVHRAAFVLPKYAADGLAGSLTH
jgi:spermidine synthase